MLIYHETTERGCIKATAGNYRITSEEVNKIINEYKLGYNKVALISADTTDNYFSVVCLLDEPKSLGG